MKSKKDNQSMSIKTMMAISDKRLDKKRSQQRLCNFFALFFSVFAALGIFISVAFYVEYGGITRFIMVGFFFLVIVFVIYKGIILDWGKNKETKRRW